MMTANQLADKAKDIATNYKTAYMLGCFGWPATEKMISRAVSANATNASKTAWQTKAKNLNAKGFMFDCVCLIKAILWGWNGNLEKSYGGATYTSNGVPDIGADQMINVCSDVSTNFAKIEVGEVVWMKGHIGVYIGDGLAVECTPKWNCCVQITAVSNIGTKAGYNARKWTKHGKLPYVLYNDVTVEETKPEETVEDKQDDLLAVGTVVQFTGNTHYTSAGAAIGKTCRPGLAKITQLAAGRAHPYHLIAVSGCGSNVYGWVDADAFSVAAPTHKVNATVGLNVRKGPGTGYAINGILKYGTEVVVAGIQNDWARLADGRGYVAAQYLTEV